MLNAKHEKFVQNLINGMSQRQAYKDAFKVNYKDEAIDNKASKLFNKDEVQARYQELLNEAKDKSIMTAIERKKWLTDIINGNIKETYVWDGEEKETTSNISTRLKAMDILNKMDGEYSTKIEGNLDLVIEVGIDES